MIAPGSALSIARQAKLLGVSRSSVYYRPQPESQQELDLLKRLDELFTENPMYGSRCLQAMLKREGILVGRRRIGRLMKKLGLWAVGPKPNTRKSHPEHTVYPYLLRDRVIDPPNQVWATDITYIRMRHGFLYPCAILDWATRRVLSWRLSVEHADERLLHSGAAGGAGTLRHARHLQYRPGQPIHRRRLHRCPRGARHPDRHGRPRTLPRQYLRRAPVVDGETEWVYLRPCDKGIEQQSLADCFDWYNRRRPHQALEWQTPDEAHFGALTEDQPMAA